MIIVNANGANIPVIGFGTWTLKDETAVRLVAHALSVGYRHIDTASLYDNEAAVGKGLRASGVKRDDVFLTTKVWYTDIADGDLQRSVEASLKRLNVDAVDLVLIHWPSKSIPLSQSIRALNEVRDGGLTRNIGVSNFPVQLLDEAVSLSSYPLACNQIEYHPFLDQRAVVAACRRHSMAVVSYCPLCRGSELFETPEIVAAAKNHERTPAQIVLRWHIQQDGVVAIPRSQIPARISENIDVFNFELGPQEMTQIGSLGRRNLRICDFAFSPQWDTQES
jgi:diketogulonate reductase-like aldo/keto reductase